ncbi:MAG: GAF domain-containing protein [Anaerolineae bacterium]|nr:GAF domain-containing protein [Anaerolineae bacterium]
MHELLQRQLEQYIGSPEAILPEWQPFIDAVEQTYRHAEAQAAYIEEQGQALLDVVQSVALGNLDVEVDIPEGVEILSELAVGIEMMIDDLSATMASQQQAQREVERRALQLATAAQVSHAATSILDPDELLQQVVELAYQRLHLYYAGLFLVDLTGERTGEPGKWAVLRAGTGEAGRQMVSDGHRLEVGGDSMIGRCVAEKEARIALYAGEERVRFRNPLLPDTRSEMALPLLARGKVIGAMTVQSDREAAFTDDDIAVLQTMADQVATAIENARLFRQTEGALLETEALYAAGRAVSQLSGLEEMVQKLCDVVVEHLGYASSWVALVDEQGQILKGVAGAGVGSTDEIVYTEIIMSPSLHNPSVQAALTGETLVIDDVLTDARADDIDAAARAFLGRMASIPIVTGSRVAGVLAVNRPATTPAISAREVDLLEAIADQAAIAVQNVSLFEQTQLALREISCLNDIGRQVNENLPLEEFLQWTAERIPPAMKYSDVCVTAIEWGDQVYGDRSALESRYQIVSSLNVGDENVGRVTIAYTEERDFVDAESGLIGNIARRISSYIENRQLAEQTRANLVETATLYRTSQSIGQSQSPSDLLRSLKELAEYFNMHSISYREIAARDADGLPTHINVYPYGIVDGKWVLHDPVLNVPTSGPAAAAMVRAPEQILIYQDAEDPGCSMPEAVRENLRKTGNRGAMTIALTARGNVIGFLSFVSPTPLINVSRRYTDVILPTLSDQIAIVLHNLQLIEQTEAALRETQLLYETSRAIAAAATPQQLLDTLVKSANVKGSKRCSLIAFEEHDPGTRPEWMERVAIWQREGTVDEIELQRLEMAKLPSTKLWEKDRIVIINDVAKEERLTEKRRAFLIDTLHIHAAVTVPLVSRERWVGVYVIEFDQPQAITERDVANYLPIADQVALAFQNQRQRERIEARARQEQVLREIIARVRGNDPETVVRTAVRELGTALGRPAFIRLGSEKELTQPLARGDGQTSQVEGGA